MTRTLRIFALAVAMGGLSAPAWANQGDRQVSQTNLPTTIQLASEQNVTSSIQLVDGRRYYRNYRPYYQPYYRPYYRPYYGPYYRQPYYGDGYYYGRPYYGRGGGVGVGPVQVWW